MNEARTDPALTGRVWQATSDDGSRRRAFRVRDTFYGLLQSTRVSKLDTDDAGGSGGRTNVAPRADEEVASAA